MDLDKFITLTKLKIEVYDETGGETGNTFTVMFNPESYSETFTNLFVARDSLDTTIQKRTYVKSMPQDLKIKIIIDGTGATDFGVESVAALVGKSESVYDKVNQFIEWTWYPENEKPNLLLLNWGALKFYCRLRSVTINYTLFDRNGFPLRAELDTHFIGDDTKNSANYKSKRFNSLKTSKKINKSDAAAASSSAASTTSASSNTSENTQKGIVITVS